MCQLLNLEKTDLENLSTFLGHDLKTHYRLPVEAIQLAKVSKIMQSVDKDISGYQGMTVNELDFVINDAGKSKHVVMIQA